MIRSDGYPSYRTYLKKPNELTIEKEKAMSMVNCVDHTLMPRTLYEELAKGFRDGFMKGMESVKYDWKDRFKVSLDGMPYEVLTAELKHEPNEPAYLRLECVESKLENNEKWSSFCPSCVHLAYSNKDICHGCKMAYSITTGTARPNNYMPHKMEKEKEKENMNVNIEDELNGYRITGTIPTFEDAIKKAIKNMNKNFSTRIVSYGIKDVIFNPPATIVFWEDGAKTVVKATNEEFDPEKGLAMAVTKRLFGNKYEYFNQVKKWTKKYYKAHPAGDA